MNPGAPGGEIQIVDHVVAKLALEAVNPGTRRIGDVGRAGLEARYLQVLVVVEESRQIDGPTALLELVADLEGVICFGRHRPLRIATHIQDAGLVAARIGSIDARQVCRLVTKHDARREAVVRQVSYGNDRARGTG